MKNAVVYVSIIRPDVRAAFDTFADVKAVFVEPGDEQGLAAALPGSEILVISNRVYTPKVGAAVLAHGKDLRWIQFSTAGFDNALTCGLPDGIVCTNAGGVRSASVAEQAMFLLLCLVRQVHALEAARAKKAWVRDEVSPSLHNLAGRRMLIVGMGPVGQAIARRAGAFDMRVAGVSRTEDAPPGVERVYPRARFLEACKDAQVVVLATGLDDETNRILGREAIAALPKDAVVVNVGRGSLVDEPALIAALQSGRIAGAGLDVAETEPLPASSPLWTLPNVVVTPHIGGAGDPSEAGVGALLAGNLKIYLSGKRFPRVVYPQS